MLRITDASYQRKRLPPVYGYFSHPLLPLHQALQPIIPRIEGLEEYIKIAKKECHFPSEHGLDRDQSAAIYLYTMDWGEKSLYRLLNAELREENRSKLIPWHGYLKVFTVALGKIPAKKRNLWRGIKGRVAHEYNENEILTWWSINSCTTKINAVEQFLGTEATIFMIEAENSKDISIYSNFPGEQEVILPLGTMLRVHSGPLTNSVIQIIHLIEQNEEQETELAAATKTLSIKAEGDCADYFIAKNNFLNSFQIHNNRTQSNLRNLFPCLLSLQNYGRQAELRTPKQ